MAQEERMLNTSQVAVILGVSQRTVANMVRSGKLQGFQIGDGKRKVYRVTRGSVDDYLARHAVLVNR